MPFGLGVRVSSPAFFYCSKTRLCSVIVISVGKGYMDYHDCVFFITACVQY